MCDQYMKTGKCWYLDNYGYCKFKHVKGLPPALSSVEGLRFEDLVGNLKYDKGTQIFTYTANPENDKEIVANVEAELATIAAELEDLHEDEDEPSEQQPFPRR